MNFGGCMDFDGFGCILMVSMDFVVFMVCSGFYEFEWFVMVFCRFN